MLRRSRPILLVAAATFALAGCGSDAGDDTTPDEPGSGEDPALVVCTSVPFPPAEFREDDELVGYDIDVMDEVGRRIDQDIRYEEVEFDSILDSLDDGTCGAAISSMAITPEREQRATFIPYLKGPDPETGGNGERDLPSDEEPPLGIAVAADDDELAASISDAIDGIYEDGAMQELMGQWDAAEFVFDESPVRPAGAAQKSESDEA